MEPTEILTFKIMITFPHLLEQRVKKYNELHGTDFEIIEIINDEVPFCIVQVNLLQMLMILNYLLIFFKMNYENIAKAISDFDINSWESRSLAISFHY